MALHGWVTRPLGYRKLLQFDKVILPCYDTSGRVTEDNLEGTSIVRGTRNIAVEKSFPPYS